MVIHFRIRYDAWTFIARGAQAFMEQAKAYQYTFIMVFAKGMFREGARDGPVCFMVVWHEWYTTCKTERGSSARKDGYARLAGKGRANPMPLLLFTSSREVLYVFVSTLVSRSVIHFFLTLALRLGMLSYIALHV